MPETVNALPAVVPAGPVVADAGTLGDGSLVPGSPDVVARYLMRRCAILARQARDRAAQGDVAPLERRLVASGIGVGPRFDAAVDKRQECPF